MLNNYCIIVNPLLEAPGLINFIDPLGGASNRGFTVFDIHSP